MCDSLFCFFDFLRRKLSSQPLPFKAPGSYPNAQNISGATVGAKAYTDADEAQEAFGFDIRGAGMLPVQAVFDNQGETPA